MKLQRVFPVLLFGLALALVSPVAAEAGHRHTRSCGHSYGSSYRQPYRPGYRSSPGYYYRTPRPAYGPSYYYGAPLRPAYVYGPAPGYYRPYYRPVYRPFVPVRPGLHVSIGLGW
jgi:hypothetical protein